jgi:hypothetical protein
VSLLIAVEFGGPCERRLLGAARGCGRARLQSQRQRERFPRFSERRLAPVAPACVGGGLAHRKRRLAQAQRGARVRRLERERCAGSGRSGSVTPASQLRGRLVGGVGGGVGAQPEGFGEALRRGARPPASQLSQTEVVCCICGRSSAVGARIQLGVQRRRRRAILLLTTRTLRLLNASKARKYHQHA